MRASTCRAAERKSLPVPRAAALVRSVGRRRAGFRGSCYPMSHPFRAVRGLAAATGGEGTPAPVCPSPRVRLDLAGAPTPSAGGAL